MRSRGDESRSREIEPRPIVLPAPFQVGQLCSVEGITETARTQVGGFRRYYIRDITHAPAAAMAGISSPVNGVDSGLFAHRGHIEALTTQMRQMIMMDASTHGWGVVCEGNASFGTVAGISEPVALKPPWSWKQFFLALKDFQPQLDQQNVLIRTDNTSWFRI